MREMQAGGIKRRRTEGGNEGVKGEGTDEIIKQDGGIYDVDSVHKSVRQQTLSHTHTHTPHAQTDLLWLHQETELSRQMLT